MPGLFSFIDNSVSNGQRRKDVVLFAYSQVFAASKSRQQQETEDVSKAGQF